MRKRQKLGLGLAAVAVGAAAAGAAAAAETGYRIESAVAIGGADAPDEAQFYEKAGPTQVDADSKGNIYVLDSGGPRLQIFDPTGRFLRGFGKGGEGPGEMKMPGALAVAADGRVAVFDLALRRISVYDATGTLLRDQLADGPIRSMHWDAQGHLVCEGRSPGGVFVEAYDTTGKTLWTSRPSQPERPGGRVMMIEIGNETVSSRLAFARNGDVFQGSDAEYGVRRLVEGKVSQTWQRPYERQARRPLPQRDDAEAGGDGGSGGALVVIQRRESGGAGGAASTQTTVSDGREVTETHTFSMDELQKMMPKLSPDIRGLLGWPDGRLWVITSADEGDTMLVDEWTEGGEYARRFGIPARYARLELGADGKLYGVSHDADEYPIVHRLNVTAVP